MEEFEEKKLDGQEPDSSIAQDGDEVKKDEYSYFNEDTAETEDEGSEPDVYIEPAYDDAEKDMIRASKKTTGVLVAIVVVLVAIIVTGVMIIYRHVGGGDDAEKVPDPIETASGTDDLPFDVDPGDSSAVDAGDEQTDGQDGGLNPADYDVTVTLGQYRGIEIDYEYEPVTEEDVDERVDELLEEYTEEVEVTDRPAQLGDVLLIDFTGYMDGEEFEGGSAVDFELELGSGSFIAGFEDGLVGANADDEVMLDLTFPDPYVPNPDYSGAPVTFKVNVTAIYALEKPEFNEEFITENTEYASTEEYRAALRAELEEEAVTEADKAAHDAIARKAIENATFEGDIDREISDTVAYWMNYYDSMYMSYYGVGAAEMFSMFYGWSEDEYYDYMYEQYDFTVRYSRLLDRIAEEEGIEVTEEEYEARFAEYFFDYYGFESREEVFGTISEEEADDMVRSSVLQEKAEAVLYDSAVINKR